MIKFKKMFKKEYWVAIKENIKYLATKMKDMGPKGVLTSIWKDLFCGRSLTQWVYLIVLAGIQVVAYIYNPSNFVAMLAGLTGILCVIYVNEKRASNYFFGLVNSIIYLFLSLKSGFYGEVLTTAFFTVMQPIGLYMWLINARHNKDEDNTAGLKVRKLTLGGWVKNILVTAAIWLGMGFAYNSIHAARPFRDSVTDGTNVTGQFLMSGGYAEQWIFWAATNVFSIYLWWGANFEITVMYWVFLLNSIVGWINWTIEAKGLKDESIKTKIKSFIPFLNKANFATTANKN